MADRHQHVLDDELIKMVKNVVDLRDNNIDYIVAPFKFQFGADASLPEPYQGFGFHHKNHMHLISSGIATADYGLVVGSGSFGVVVVGKHRRSQRVVAVKISEAAKEADLKEARLMRELGHHPNIVHVEDCYYEESSRRLFVVMELMQGNLRALVESREDQKLSETELKVLTRGLASGLQHMHNHDKNGVMHRDIKPSNLLITWGVDNQLVVKLADFGTAKPLPDNTSEPQTFTGTLGFQPREMKAGEAYDKSCDIWSAGVTVAACGAGRGYIGGANSSTEAGASGNPVVAELLKKHKDAAIVQRMAMAERNLRPTAEDILKDDWVADSPNEDAVSTEELEKAQGRVAEVEMLLASKEAEQKEAVQKKEHEYSELEARMMKADAEIVELRERLAACGSAEAQANGNEGVSASNDAGGSKDEVRRSARLRSSTRGIRCDDDGSDDHDGTLASQQRASPTPGSSPRNGEDGFDVEGASPSTSSALASTQAPAYSDTVISSLIEDRGYSEPLAEKIRGLHGVVNAGKTDCHKFLQSYSPTDLERKVWEDFRQQCVSANSSNGIVYAILTGPFLVAAIERIRRAIFTDRDFSKSTEIESDTIGLLMGHYHFLNCRLVIATQEVAEVKKAIAKLPIRPGMSRKDVFENCSKEEGKLGESTPKLPSSSAQLRMGAMNKACLTELGRVPSARKPGPNLNELDTLFAIKCGQYLLGHLTAIDIVLDGMKHIPFEQLSAALRTKVASLASAQGFQITDSAMISNAFEKVIMPALDDDAYEKRAIGLLLDTMVELKDMPDKFVGAASKEVHGTDGDDSDGDDEDGKDIDENSVDNGLPNLKDYLVITAGVLLSKCISRKLKSTVGFEEDMLEIILRCSSSYLEKHLRPLIWPAIGKGEGAKPSPSFIFADDISEDGMGLIVKNLEELVTRARSSNFCLPKQGIKKSEWKSFEFWKKRSMLQANSENESLVARALIMVE